MRSRAVIAAIVVIAAACGQVADATPELAWAAYSFPRAPRYQLMFEGSTDGRQVAEVRILDASGAVVAQVATTVTANETLRLCGGGKSGAGTYGPMRATFVVDEALWNDAVSRPDSMRAEVRIGSAWRTASLKHICVGQVD